MQIDDYFIPAPIPPASLIKLSATWQAPSNIALIKYWGKKEPQLPENASLSLTLSESKTITTVDFKPLSSPRASVIFDFYFDGKPKPSFHSKLATFFDRIAPYMPFLLQYRLRITTSNTFPHSSGIASSASGMAALSLCLMQLEKQLNPSLSDAYFNKKASFLARLGSGSACRSIEGPITLWGRYQEIPESSNLFAIQKTSDIHPIFTTYCDSVLLVDKGVKVVSSTVGHELMHEHPFAQARFKQANENLSLLLAALKQGDLPQFIHIVEKEALSLHAMMMTSKPYFMLMKPNTLHIIQKIWEFRASTKLHCCFTLDAGANVHLLYPERESTATEAFIRSELLPFCENNHFIRDKVGPGAKKL